MGVDERAAAANIARGGWRACAESWGGGGEAGKKKQGEKRRKGGGGGGCGLDDHLQLRGGVSS